MNKDIELIGIAYQLGDAAYTGDFKRYRAIHAKFRKAHWSILQRFFYRLGLVYCWLKKK